MDERDYRNSLTKEELEARQYIITVKVKDFELMERLNLLSQEMDKTWDELINSAIEKMLSDIMFIRKLRM